MGKPIFTKKDILDNLKEEKKEEFYRVMKERLEGYNKKKYFGFQCPATYFGTHLNKTILLGCNLTKKRYEKDIPRWILESDSCNICWYHIVLHFVDNKKTNMKEW